MKRSFILHSILCLLVASCSFSETDPIVNGDNPQDKEVVFYATLESTPETKVYVDENVKVLWDANDLVSIFNKSTANQKYQFQGSTGANSGYFTSVQSNAGTGNQTDMVCAVYPYRESNAVNNGTITITLPAEQTYREGSFGDGANAMVSVSDGNQLNFKNVGGYLVLKFYGDGVSISSIKLEGNNHEKLSGEATVTPSLSTNWVPTVTMSSTAGESITLTCDPPVELGSTAEESKVFWMVVPPTQFSEGFTLTVTDGYGNELVKTADAFPIGRNQVRRIVPIEVPPIPTYSIENEMLAAYLDAVDANPYNPSDYSNTHMTSTLYDGNTSQTNRLDWPKPVPVSWTNPASGSAGKTVYVYNDKEKTKLELTVEVSSSTSTTADVYNLIPGRVYYYSVMNGDSEISSGAFETTGRRRMIKVGDSPYGKQYANNCRDFGGQITQDGRMIKYGKMYRGSNMDKTNSLQKSFLTGYMGIGLDVDLRKDDSSNAGKGENALYDALGLGNMHTTESYDSWEDLSDVSKMSATLNKVFSAVAADKAVYIHCKVGADRTGYVCMLLEALLGLSQGACDVDYELTSFSGAVDEGEPRTRNGGINYYYRSKDNTTRGVDYINTFSGATFQAKAIDYVVKTLGISMETITTFQNKMLE